MVRWRAAAAGVQVAVADEHVDEEDRAMETDDPRCLDRIEDHDADSARMKSGCRPTASQCGTKGRRWNTITKVKR